MSEQKTGCMPDGYMPIPTAEQIADALENVRCFHDMSAELIAPELLANLLAALSAQQSAQPVSSALADLAGDRFEAPVAGWSAPAQDERKTFEAWAKTQGDKWLIVGGLQWSAGTDDYASARTNAAWAAWQERAALSARPAQTEQQPAPGESWIPWRGGECPLPPSTPVEYRMRRDARSVVRIDLAGKLDWEHHGGRIGKSDVVAYRAALSAQGAGDASA